MRTERRRCCYHCPQRVSIFSFFFFFSTANRKMKVLTLFVCAVLLSTLVQAEYFEAWVADPTSVKQTLFIVSDTVPLVSSGASFATSVGQLNITTFGAGSSQAKCSGDQLNFNVTVAMKSKE